MKRVLIIITLLFHLTSLIAQELKYEAVVQDSLKTQKELFNLGKLWINDTYKSGKSVIQMENEELGIIVGKATMKYSPSFFASSIPAKGYVNYTIKLSFKEGRYKYEFYDFIHEGSKNESGQDGTIGLINDGEIYLGKSKAFGKNYRNKVNKDTQELIKSKIPAIINSLTNYMKNNNISVSSDNDDW